MFSISASTGKRVPNVYDTAMIAVAKTVAWKKEDFPFRWFEFKNKPTWVDVYMRALKTFVDGSGRTVVHFKACPFIGTDNFCENSVLCAKRHQSASIGTGIISNLRKGLKK